MALATDSTVSLPLLLVIELTPDGTVRLVPQPSVIASAPPAPPVELLHPIEEPTWEDAEWQ